jgi:hypothetical protein
MPLKKWLLTLITVCVAFASFAQYKQHLQFNDYYTKLAVGNERIYQRITIGGGLTFMSGNYTFAYNGQDTLGKAISDTLTKKYRSKDNYVFYLGTFFPITLITDNSMLAFNTEVMFSMATLDFDSVEFAPKVVYKKREKIVSGGLQLSLDYKWGGDVPLERNSTMFTLGAGLSFTRFESMPNLNGLPIRAIPFVKADVGFYAGLAFKLRGMVYFGSDEYRDKTYFDAINTDRLHVNVKGSYGFNIALLILPFSAGWEGNW